MADERVIGRIEAWEAAGLIDADTANRLRAAEAAEMGEVAPPEPRPVPDGGGRSAAATFFGPMVSIGEVFGYVGAGFLLAAWHAIVSTYVNDASVADGFESQPDAFLRTLQLAVPAIILAILGFVGSRRSEREQRAAGVAFGVAVVHAGFATLAALQGQATPPSGEVVAVVATAVAAVAAAIFRVVHGSVLTQVGLLGSLAALSTALLAWLNVTLFPTDELLPLSAPPDSGAAQLRVILTLAWWIGWTVAFGLLALREARAAAQPDAPAGEAARAGRRLTVTRFVAGLTAVLGTWSAISQSTFDASGTFGRVVPVALGDLLILVVAAVLVWLAFRREATAYIYPAAIGVIVALTDLNSQTIGEERGVGVALFVEGVILLGGGILADRLRRRLAPRAGGPPGPGAGPVDPVAGEAPS